MQWLAEVSVRRPVFATVMSLVIMVVGGFFYTNLGVDQFPKIDIPIVVVLTRQPGAAPADIEADISDKIEGAVNTISGIDELRSNSSEGVSQVVIQFLLEKNTDVAVTEVQQKINGVLMDLPRGIDPPQVIKLDPDSQPIMYIALEAPGRDPKAITDVADRVVKRRLESISGVGEVKLLGAQKRQVNVWLDPARLKSLSLSPLEVSRAIDAQNQTLPGGRVDVSRDQLTVRVYGRVQSIEELARIIVRDQDGRQIRVQDVARVEDGVQEVETSARWNGEPTIVLLVRKQSGTNTIEVADNLRERLLEVEKELPSGYKMSVQRDGSEVVRTGTDAVNEHLILGAFFAAIIVLLFLGNVRSTLIAAVAIPTSIVGTFALMYMKGYTLNTITLLALALAVGIVIDDAIVVLENIFRFVDEKGYEPKEAAIEGTREIGLAVLATTLSLIAVFLPIAFIAGIPGRFLSSFGITMSFAVAVSLFVSFTLTPMLASQWLRKKIPGQVHKKNVLERLVDVGYRPIERWYMRVLAWSMAHRLVILSLSIATIVSTYWLGGIAKKGFLPVDDRAQFEVILRMPEGRSLAYTEVWAERIAREIRQLETITATMVTIGDDEQKTPNQARIYVKMTNPELRQLTQNEMKAIIRNKIFPLIPSDAKASVADVNEFGGAGQSTATIQYLVAGPELGPLYAANEAILAKMKEVPGAVDIDSSLVVGKPEIGIVVDRDRAADLGVQVSDIAQALQIFVAGQKVSTYAEGGETYEVRVRAGEDYRNSEDALRQITVPSRKLGLVPLADVVKFNRGEGPSTIQRFNRQRQITFAANPAPGFGQGNVSDGIVAAIESAKLPQGYGIKPSGQSKFLKQTAISFIIGLLASMVFMYLILAAQFESWIHPITILMSLPLTLPFAILSVIMFDQALDIYSFLGIFVLFGVVKKNAILQIDHTNHLRAEGMNRLDAIMQANKDRLRPILMTTFAFAAGMIPLVTARGIGSGFNKATAGVVVGGQMMSLLLTLVAVPVIYSYMDDITVFFARIRARLFNASPEPDAANPAVSRSAPAHEVAK